MKIATSKSMQFAISKKLEMISNNSHITKYDSSNSYIKGNSNNIKKIKSKSLKKQRKNYF